MGRRKTGTYPYDYTPGDDGRFADSGVGATLRVVHVGGQVRQGAPLRGTARGDHVVVTVRACFGEDEGEVTAAVTALLTGDVDDVAWWPRPMPVSCPGTAPSPAASAGARAFDCAKLGPG